jgi:hypothetical protein
VLGEVTVNEIHDDRVAEDETNGLDKNMSRKSSVFVALLV